MPRPGPRRPQVAVRLADDVIAQVDRRSGAEAAGGRSEMIRRLIAYGLQYMPPGWSPD
jgi:metal-responsive CopG/Arc/MetJ family transcriptional regulator